MSDNTIPTAVDGTRMPASDHNSLRTAFIENVVPRNSGAVATDIAGSLGTSSLEWLKAFIASGYWNAGDIKSHHSYNGAVGPGHGWMLCDGRVINETNYNAEHGAGTWDIYVLGSSLDGLYLPSLVSDTFTIGSSTTTQDGTSPITKIGSNNDILNLQHNHTVDAHNHQWYDLNSGVPSQTYNSSGVATNITGTAGSTAHIGAIFSGYDSIQNAYTDNQSPNTDSSLSSGLNVDTKPKSIEVQFYMRII